MTQRFLPRAAAAVLALCIGGSAFAQNVAVVNGKTITNAQADLLFSKLANRQGKKLSPEDEKKLRSQLKDEMINREVLDQEAQKLGLENTPQFKNEMDLARQSILIGMLFEDFQKKNKPSDAEVKAEYNRVVAQMGAGSGGKEYKSRHILVETEDQAKALIVQINKGAKFADVAKKNSKDPGSGANGGDLGWADPAGFVPEFGNSLKSLKKGQMTQTPVKSQFGYHIILLEDSRDLKRPPPPKLEEVKEQVSQKILQDKSEAWRKNIRDKATIK